MYRPGRTVRLDRRPYKELQYGQGQPAQPLIFQGRLVSHTIPHGRPGAVGRANKTGRVAMEGLVVCENLSPNVGLELTHDYEIGMMGCQQFVMITDGEVRRSTTLTIVRMLTRMTAMVNRQQ